MAKSHFLISFQHLISMKSDPIRSKSVQNEGKNEGRFFSRFNSRRGYLNPIVINTNAFEISSIPLIFLPKFPQISPRISLVRRDERRTSWKEERELREILERLALRRDSFDPGRAIDASKTLVKTGNLLHG